MFCLACANKYEKKWMQLTLFYRSSWKEIWKHTDKIMFIKLTMKLLRNMFLVICFYAAELLSLIECARIVGRYIFVIINIATKRILMFPRRNIVTWGAMAAILATILKIRRIWDHFWEVFGNYAVIGMVIFMITRLFKQVGLNTLNLIFWGIFCFQSLAWRPTFPP